MLKLDSPAAITGKAAGLVYRMFEIHALTTSVAVFQYRAHCCIPTSNGILHAFASLLLPRKTVCIYDHSSAASRQRRDVRRVLNEARIAPDREHAGSRRSLLVGFLGFDVNRRVRSLKDWVEQLKRLPCKSPQIKDAIFLTCLQSLGNGCWPLPPAALRAAKHSWADWSAV